jgi:hypothetical protein
VAVGQPAWCRVRRSFSSVAILSARVDRFSKTAMFGFWTALSLMMCPSFVMNPDAPVTEGRIETFDRIPLDVERREIVHDKQARIKDDDLDPRLPTHECKPSHRDRVDAGEDGVSNVARKSVMKKKTRSTTARHAKTNANAIDPSLSGVLDLYVLVSKADSSAC